MCFVFNVKTQQKQTWYNLSQEGSVADISIHDEIGGFGVSGSSFLAEMQAMEGVDEINLSIHSPGGDVLEGWAIYNAIKNFEGIVSAKVEGFAGSMASVILMAADEIVMPSNSYLMIHNPYVGLVGDSQALGDAAATLEKIQNSIVSVYVERTGLTREQVQDLMDRETFMDGNEAVDLGFADRVEESFKAAAFKESWANSITKDLPKGLVFGEISGQPETKPTNHKELPHNMSEEVKPEAPAINIKDIRDEERHRIGEISAIGQRFNVDEKEINSAIDSGKATDEFRAEVMNNFDPSKFAAGGSNESVYVGEKEVQSYSVLKAVNEHINGGLTGLEREVQDELTQRFRAASGDTPKGILIPGEVSHGVKNAATVGTTTSGGHTVATELQPVVDYFEDYSLLPALGATIFRDATGNLSFPTATSGYTGSFDGETDTIANADAVFSNFTMTPKRVGAGTSVSLQLLQQSSVDFEGWIRSKLGQGISIAIDRGAFTGAGGDAPTGILNASGTSAYTWQVGNSAHQNVIDQWKELRDAKVPLTSAKWLSEPGVTADWMATPKESGQANYVIDENPNGTQRALGYEYYDHTDITANKVIFGQFSSLLVCLWGGIDLTVDPYSSKNSGTVELFANAFADAALEQPSAFVIGDNGTTHA